MDRLPLGCALLAGAAVAWILLLLLGADTGAALDLLPILLGMGLAAWALRARRDLAAAAGLVLAALGIAWFYGGAFLEGLASVAGAVYAVGCLAAAAALWRRNDATLAAGFALVALAGLLWVFADGVAGWRWQAGNLLTVAGGVVAALGARGRTAPA